MPVKLEPSLVSHLVDIAFREDFPAGDITTTSIFANEQGYATISAKMRGIMAGLPLIKLIYHKLDPTIQIELLVAEGSPVTTGSKVATISGPIRSILIGERTCLNFLQRISGIATATHRSISLMADSKTRIVDTRKTIPGWRYLDKYAVSIGGGQNHRLSLSDAVMIKDNHIRGAGGITQAVSAVRCTIPLTAKIEVEVSSLAEVKEALHAKVDIIMLDNMSISVMREAIAYIGDQSAVEISGNVTVDTLPQLINLGADYISIGALTHSVTAFDLSMNIEQKGI